MTVRASAALAVLAILALVAGAIAAVPSAAVAQTPSPTENATVSPDTVRLHVTVQDDGTAQWYVEYRLILEDDAQIEAFESLQDDIEKNRDAYTSEFLQTLSPAVDRAANKTGRSMELRNASVSTKKQALARPTGIVIYRFEWTSFARVTSDKLLVGDALSGFYVNDETTLRIEWPSGYELQSVTPSADDRSDNAVVWHGPADFGSDEPRLELTPTSPIDDVPLPVAAAALFTVVATLGIAVRVRRGSGESGGDGEVAAAADVDADTESSSEQDSSLPPELMSNEERVLTALEENDGRMKQQALAEQLDWGAPKMSRVVGDLREEDKVEVFRLGRENVVTLPEEELL